MFENPWAYHEARNKLREQQEKNKEKLEKLVEDFEREKKLQRANKKFDIFELRQKIETNQSLNILKKEIQEALKEGIISRESFDKLQKDINILDKNIDKVMSNIDKKMSNFDNTSTENLPFSNAELTKFFENKKIGENVFIDIAWFSYGFFVQGSAILVILLWKIFLDIIFLPRDIYNELKMKKE